MVRTKRRQGPSGRFRRSRWLAIWLTPWCCFVGASAHAHHIIGTPHYVVDSDYPDPILTLTEAVGPWRLTLTQAPGNPDAAGTATIRLQVNDAVTGEPFRQAISVQIQQQRAFGSGVDIYGPESVPPEEGAYEFEVTYPRVGNYIVSLTLREGEKPLGLVFPVVVGQPGRPWVSLASFIIGVALLMLIVRAIKVKQLRRKALSP